MIDQVHLVLTIHSACPSRAGPIKSRAAVDAHQEQGPSACDRHGLVRLRTSNRDCPSQPPVPAGAAPRPVKHPACIKAGSYPACIG